jgi:caa(3)-type oxidase subunit IV
VREAHARPSYVAIWWWLVGLLAAGVAAARLPAGKVAILGVIFGIAVVKATLVARYYMHLRGEHLLVLTIAGVPVLLVVGFILSLVPDMVFGR